jgi:hypothetical protein
MQALTTQPATCTRGKCKFDECCAVLAAAADSTKAAYIITKWTACSADCGTAGTRTRTVTCSGTGTDACGASADAPVASQACKRFACSLNSSKVWTKDDAETPPDKKGRRVGVRMDLDFDAITNDEEAFIESATEDIANALDIPVSRILNQVLSAGSVVMDFDLADVDSQSASSAETLAAQLADNTSTQYSALLQGSYTSQTLSVSNTDNATPDSSSSSSDDNTAMYAGIGAGAGVVLLGVGFLLLRKKGGSTAKVQPEA